MAVLKEANENIYDYDFDAKCPCCKNIYSCFNNGINICPYDGTSLVHLHKKQNPIKNLILHYKNKIKIETNKNERLRLFAKIDLLNKKEKKQ